MRAKVVSWRVKHTPVLHYPRFKCARCGRSKNRRSPDILCRVCRRIMNIPFSQVMATSAEIWFERTLIESVLELTRGRVK